jgi:hypothetical protein
MFVRCSSICIESRLYLITFIYHLTEIKILKESIFIGKQTQEILFSLIVLFQEIN